MRNIYLGFLFRFDGVFVVNRTWKMCFATLHKSNCISWCKFAFYFAQKKLLFQFYALIFTKHPHQFIYSTHLFNKIFVFFTIFSYSPSSPLSLTDQHSLTDPNPDPTLSHKPIPNTQRSIFLFGSSTQTQNSLLLIFFISCLVGENVVEKSRNRRKDDRQHSLTDPDLTRKEK